MRKRIINASQSGSVSDWLPIENCAEIELTSEDPLHSIDAALLPGPKGWRAGEPGEQTIRLVFDEPQWIRRIHLVFSEEAGPRTQEFVLRSSKDGKAYRDVVRQQFNFSPGTVREVEDYHVQLDGVLGLELKITPDISRAPAIASLDEWLIG